jgi:hypothetical protein
MRPRRLAEPTLRGVELAVRKVDLRRHHQYVGKQRRKELLVEQSLSLRLFLRLEGLLELIESLAGGPRFVAEPQSGAGRRQTVVGVGPRRFLPRGSEKLAAGPFVLAPLEQHLSSWCNVACEAASDRSSASTSSAFALAGSTRTET